MQTYCTHIRSHRYIHVCIRIYTHAHTHLHGSLSSCRPGLPRDVVFAQVHSVLFIITCMTICLLGLLPKSLLSRFTWRTSPVYVLRLLQPLYKMFFACIIGECPWCLRAVYHCWKYAWVVHSHRLFKMSRCMTKSVHTPGRDYSLKAVPREVIYFYWEGRGVSSCIMCKCK